MLGAILTLAGSTADLTQGVALLGAYSLGLAVPFLLIGLSAPKLGVLTRRLGRGMALVQAGSGALLVAMGRC